MKFRVERVIIFATVTALLLTGSWLFLRFPTLASFNVLGPKQSPDIANQDSSTSSLSSVPSSSDPVPAQQNDDIPNTVTSDHVAPYRNSVQSLQTIEWISEGFRTKLLDLSAREVLVSNVNELFESRRSVPSFQMYLHPSPDIVSDFIRRDGGWRDCFSHVHSLTQLQADHSRPNVVIDVGGNIGSCALMYGAMGFKVISFEPTERNYRLFAASIQVNVNKGILNKSGPKSVTLYPMGASDVDEVKNIYVEAGNNGNSIIASVAMDQHSFSGAESILTAKVSHIVRERIGFAKLDCQGYEFFALRGMKELIRTYGIDQITFELEPTWARAVGVQKPEEILTFLDSLGYTIVRMNGKEVLTPENFENFVSLISSSAEDLTAYSKKIFPVIPPPSS
ncbi:S-adenosyl-L-methionine-dependent methyltransferase [Cladochytrium replicatum]|nr:S-adenosyl-L-methionine-dependent methyltransferase [Cladochytrium replicatum]